VIVLISGSSDYEAAVTQTKALFPDGLCCPTNPDLAREQVLPEFRGTAVFCILM